MEQWEYLSALLRINHDHLCWVEMGGTPRALAELGNEGWELTTSGPWMSWLEDTGKDLPPGYLSLPKHKGYETPAIFKRKAGA